MLYLPLIVTFGFWRTKSTSRTNTPYEFIQLFFQLSHYLFNLKARMLGVWRAKRIYPPTHPTSYATVKDQRGNSFSFSLNTYKGPIALKIYLNGIRVFSKPYTQICG